MSRADCYLQSRRLGFSLTSSRCTATRGLSENPTCSDDWSVCLKKANRFGLAFPIFFINFMGLVRRRGLEPLCLAALAPQASASANFATSALYLDAEGRELR
jgi:hypothetical protein